MHGKKTILTSLIATCSLVYKFLPKQNKLINKQNKLINKTNKQTNNFKFTTYFKKNKIVNKK